MSYIQNNVKSDVTKDVPDFFPFTRKTIHGQETKTDCIRIRGDAI